MTLPVPPLLPTRPWLSLYGNFLKPQAIPPSAQQQQQQQSEVQVDPVEVELAPIQELLPDEMLQHVLARLSPYMLGHIACVCRHWRSIAEVGPLVRYMAYGGKEHLPYSSVFAWPSPQLRACI